MGNGERNDNRKHFGNGNAGITDDNIININIDPRDFAYKENNPLHNTNAKCSSIYLIQIFQLQFPIYYN